ncbi:MAG: type IV pilin N-terminal domain-containing protein [Methanocorpusculum sp.]|nr:type IV pilin N-terminal domain-containing protein [Methanocorpusculum sp.]
MSPVIGTILLVALVVIVIALGSSIFIGMTNNVGGRPAFTTVDIGVDGDNIFVKHKYGEPVEAGQLKIYCDGYDRTNKFLDAEKKFDSGSNVEWEKCFLPVGYVTVVKRDGNSEWLIDSKYIGKRAGSDETVKALIERADNYCNSDTNDLKSKWTFTDNGWNWIYVPMGGIVKFNDKDYYVFTSYGSMTTDQYTDSNNKEIFIKGQGTEIIPDRCLLSTDLAEITTVKKGELYYENGYLYVLVENSASKFPTTTEFAVKDSGWICCGPA